MRGYKTLALNLLALVCAWFGFQFDPEIMRDHAEKIVSFLAAANMALRVATKGPVATKPVRVAVREFIKILLRSPAKQIAAVVLLPLVLGACSAEHRAALAYADDQAKTFKDTEARVLLRAPCAMSVGAYWRALDDELRKSVDALCKRP